MQILIFLSHFFFDKLFQSMSPGSNFFFSRVFYMEIVFFFIFPRSKETNIDTIYLEKCSFANFLFVLMVSVIH